MSVFQRGETYIQQRKFRADNTLLEVDSATLQITFPCASGTASASMTKSTGTIYSGIWAIPSNATYGEYLTKVTAVKDGETTIFEDSFFVLPWNMLQQLRSVSGIKQSNDIDDNDLALIAWNAYLEAKEEVFDRHIDVALPKDGYHCIDGSNKVFYAETRLVSGYAACDEVEISGYYLDCELDRFSLTISITDADLGEISVADESGNALESDTCQVYITYSTKTSAFTDHLFRKAVAYLAAREVVLRLNELDKATLADLPSNRLASPERMLRQYRQTIRKIKSIRVGGIV